ncbi:hypothetical protein [Rubrivirga litoralis]|uniref:Uncharacterized protein n=1 Tax=Rubrivirga litoralis TaxID=3075598 RepID=A0ABU3BUL8_9BACT|nr:hypothetical protein [Rubrivirga sp. F394]MDT0632930.1 hypothetical protein [Rubrivirga sp. F394]
MPRTLYVTGDPYDRALVARLVALLRERSCRSVRAATLALEDEGIEYDGVHEAEIYVDSDTWIAWLTDREAAALRASLHPFPVHPVLPDPVP